MQRPGVKRLRNRAESSLDKGVWKGHAGLEGHRKVSSFLPSSYPTVETTSTKYTAFLSKVS